MANKFDGAGNQTRTFKNGLRPFNDLQFVVGLGVDVSRRRIHTDAAAAVKKLVVGSNR